MAIRIGHASIDENGKAAGGAAGDQTGKEVCIRSWYNGGWQFVARAKAAAVAEGIAAAAEAGCNNPNLGYNQSRRNTLNTAAKAAGYDLAKITAPCEADCSSFVSVCVRAALGRDFYTGNAPTTGTLKKVLESTGAFEILTDSKYLASSESLRRGDILCRPGKHTVIVLDNGSRAGEDAAAPSAAYASAIPTLKKGGRGDTVKALQILLIGWGCDCGSWGADGDFGAATETAVKTFQKAGGLTVDGIAGPRTWTKLLGL